MHYSVLVIGDHPGEQLADYNERLQVPDRRPASKKHYTELVAKYGLGYTEEDARDIAYADGYEDAELTPEREVFLLSSFNPNGRWDWWIPGGRWAGLLPTTQKALEAAQDNRLEGEDEAKLGDVLWNEATLRLVYSLVVDGVWYDLEKDESGGQTLLEQFRSVTSQLDPGTAVTVVDCHT